MFSMLLHMARSHWPTRGPARDSKGRCSNAPLICGAAQAQAEHARAELAIVNAVQAALAGNLDIQGIYEAVGDRLRERPSAGDLGIRAGPRAGTGALPYHVENGNASPSI